MATGDCWSRGKLISPWLMILICEQFSCAASFKAHPSESVSALGVGPRGGSLAGHVVVGCADGSAKLWRIDEGQAVELQSLDSKGKLPLDFEMAYLPGSASRSRSIPSSKLTAVHRRRPSCWMYRQTDTAVDLQLGKGMSVPCSIVG